MSNFHLNNEDEEFKSRSNDIFSMFDSIKSQIKEENFKFLQKRKAASAGQNNSHSIPQFKTEPHKWTKYSLESVIASDDRQNTQTALSFLHELCKQKNYSENVCSIDLKTDCAIASSSAMPMKEKKCDHQQSYICFKKPMVITQPHHEADLKTKQLKQSKSKQINGSFDKVELHHLEENVSAMEYQAAIEAKLDDSLFFSKSNCDSRFLDDSKGNEAFKSQKSSKTKRILRKRELK